MNDLVWPLRSVLQLKLCCSAGSADSIPSQITFHSARAPLNLDWNSCLVLTYNKLFWKVLWMFPCKNRKNKRLFRPRKSRQQLPHPQWVFSHTSAACNTSFGSESSQIPFYFNTSFIFLCVYKLFQCSFPCVFNMGWNCSQGGSREPLWRT